MGDLRLKSSDGLLWKDNKIFTGSITSYPVELFISAIESEARTLNDSQEQMCQNAWNRISEGKSSPSGVWKAKMQEKYNDKSSFLWNDMKKDLLEAFGRTDFAYTFEEKFEFLLSLTRGERESLTAYLSRVEWVMNSPLAYTAGDTSWMKMMFLLGLQVSASKKCQVLKCYGSESLGLSYSCNVYRYLSTYSFLKCWMSKG